MNIFIVLTRECVTFFVSQGRETIMDWKVDSEGLFHLIMYINRVQPSWKSRGEDNIWFCWFYEPCWPYTPARIGNRKISIFSQFFNCCAPIFSIHQIENGAFQFFTILNMNEGMRCHIMLDQRSKLTGGSFEVFHVIGWTVKFYRNLAIS